MSKFKQLVQTQAKSHHRCHFTNKFQVFYTKFSIRFRHLVLLEIIWWCLVAKHFPFVQGHRFNKSWRQKWKSPFELIKAPKQELQMAMCKLPCDTELKSFPSQGKRKIYNTQYVSPFWLGASSLWEWSNKMARQLISVLSIYIHVFLSRLELQIQMGFFGDIICLALHR